MAVEKDISLRKINEDIDSLQIFLCHFHEDEPSVLKLYRRLRKEGFDPWLDKKKLLGGQDWELEIHRAIFNSDIILVCLSKKVIDRSGYIHKEIKLALDANDQQPEGKIHLIPVKLEECEVPERLRKKQWINLFKKDGYEQLMKSFINRSFENKTHESYEMKKEEMRSDKTEIFPETYINSVGMKFVLVPSGNFMMGSEDDDREKPVHEVAITKPFYLGIYPVTQYEWRQVMGENPSILRGKKLPVENVSWGKVNDFIDKLNERESTNKYDLPSEAEWEYAARAGTTTRFYFGDDESKIGDYAWYSENSKGKTRPVGQKKPNPWGLYDMLGNVWEWVKDNGHEDYKGAPTDGSAWECRNCSRQVNRGGSWNNFSISCRLASRTDDEADFRAKTLGFRIMKVL